MGPPENPTRHLEKQARGGRKRPVRRPRKRKCLLKGCGLWFPPRHARQRYCSEGCCKAARTWSEWKARQKWRASGAGKRKRNGQSRRYRERRKSQKASEKAVVPEAERVIPKDFFRGLLRPARVLRVLPAVAALAAATVLLSCMPARDAARLGTRAALATETRHAPPFAWKAALCAAAMKARR